MGWDAVADFERSSEHKVTRSLSLDPYGYPDVSEQRKVPNKPVVDTMESVAPPKEAEKKNDQKKV